MSSLASLRTKVRRLIGEEDSSDTRFSDDEINDYINQAVQFLGTEMEWAIQVSTATSVEDQALYALPEKFLSLVEVYFDNELLPILEREDLPSIDAQWQDAESSKPRVAYRADRDVLGLYPPPDADNADLTIQISCIQYPDTLSTDVDVPDIHSSFQLCLPFYAAFLAEVKAGNDKRADLQFARYETHKKLLMSRVQKFSDDLMRFKWG